VTEAGVELAKGKARAPDAVVDADPAAFLALVQKRETLSQADVRVEGDAAAVDRLLAGIP
jgi:hypothetical protein